MIIKNAKIFTCENNKIIENGYIITKNGKISEVDEMAKFKTSEKNEDEIFDAQGKIITPGFVDAHCHLGICEDGLGFEGEDANEETDPITPQLRALDAINPFEKSFEEALLAGVTTVCISPGSANCIAGQIVAIKTKGKRIDKMLINDFSAMKLAFGENPKTVYSGKNQAPNTRMATAALIREAFEKAKRYNSDIEKSENSTDEEDDIKPEFDSKCEALIPLLKGQIKAHIHAHRGDDIFTAIRIAKEFNLNFVIVHGTDSHLIVSELKEDEVFVMLGPIIGGRTKPELANHSINTACELEKEGITFCIISDHPETPVQMLPLSAAVCKGAGLSYFGALNAITINAAIILGIDDKVGSIKKGKEADFLIFNGDPLSGFNKPELIIINGEKANRNKR